MNEKEKRLNSNWWQQGNRINNTNTKISVNLTPTLNVKTKSKDQDFKQIKLDEIEGQKDHICDGVKLKLMEEV